MRTISDNNNLLNFERNPVLDIITPIKYVITLGHEVIANRECYRYGLNIKMVQLLSLIASRIYHRIML